MLWKKYKAMPASEKRDEIYYIIGLDIGNDSSAIAFYNMMTGEPEVIDLSGGYGRPTVPTVMQYIVENKEWVYGEYAIQNQNMGKEITLNGLIDRLGSHDYVDIDNKPVSLSNLLGLYIKELMSNVKNINPKAEIAGIVAAVPSYFSNQAKEEMWRAFKYAGYEKELIALVPDRECVFSYHFSQDSQISHDDRPRADKKCLLIDYGAREVRGGVYADIIESRKLKSLSSLFEDSIGTQKIEEQVNKLFMAYYGANNPIQARQGLDKATQDQLSAFTFSHKDILFQKSIRNKPTKLYFNFAFPPFAQTVTIEEADKLIKPFRRRFDQFIGHVLEVGQKSQKSEKFTAQDIDVVICIGGGFEMLWARESLESLFPQGKLHMYKNPKSLMAMGAAVVAAQMLEAADGEPVSVEDRHQLAVDIGLNVVTGGANSKFIPLVECNSFWWQTHPTRLFIVNAPVEGELPFSILSRSPDGETNALSDVPLTGLPKRPKGTTRLSVQLKFTSDSEALVMISDIGFGEMFPKSGYEQEISFSLM